MATFITSLILWGFIAAVLGFVGKLIYDIQQNKKVKTENEFEAKEAFQKLAGITPVDKNDEIREILVKNNLNSKERIIEEMMKAVQNSEFPAPDQSIPVVTAKLTTIDTKFEEADPLASVPMSRVSKEAKQKMAEIAKEDISNQLEQNVEKFEALTNQKACGCGRSETGFCTGLHRISKTDWAAGVRDIPAEKPKRKPNPKQIGGAKSEEPFVKTRKKTTKKTK